MDEDVLGPRQTVIGARYDTCSRCGRLVPRDQVTVLHVAGEGPSIVADMPGAPRPEEATRDGPPPVLCPTCRDDLAAGEPFSLPRNRRP